MVKINKKNVKLPIIINITDEDLNMSRKMIKSKHKYNRELIIKIINKYNNEISILLEKQVTICEIDCPKTKKSYDIIINPLINAFDKKIKYCSTKLKKYFDLNEDIANIIIDTSLKRLIISIYYGSNQLL